MIHAAVKWFPENNANDHRNMHSVLVKRIFAITDAHYNGRKFFQVITTYEIKSQ